VPGGRAVRPQHSALRRHEARADWRGLRCVSGNGRAPSVDNGVPAYPAFACSGAASSRHPRRSTYGCCLPALTGFAVPRRARPLPSTPRHAGSPTTPGLEKEFNPCRAGSGCRAPLPPHLARPPKSVVSRFLPVKAGDARSDRMRAAVPGDPLITVIRSSERWPAGGRRPFGDQDVRQS
jgi:hypothetical protein